MSIVGSALLWLTFFSGSGAILFGIWGINKQKEVLSRQSRWLSLVSIWSITAAAGLLMIAFVTDNFSLAYVARSSQRSLPPIYKISAFWAGQAGSLLLWHLIISLFLWYIHGAKKYRTGHLDIKLNIMINTVRVLFTVILLFLSQPFAATHPIPRDGAGLNPMLQSVGMIVHPPILFLGFSGCLIPIALAAAELIWSPGHGTWMKQCRSWALFAWGMLTLGIVTGGWWAYNELGWGGYWAWDPVENASLFPWLTATAFLHAMLVPNDFYGKELLSYSLAGITFLLTIFGTYLTRSGVLDSVHAFSNETMGNVFLGALLIMAIFIIGLGISRRRVLLGAASRTADGQRRAAFLFVNIILLMLIFAGVFLGTMFPLISRTFLKREVILDEGFFNAISVPLFIILVFLMGAYPAVERRRFIGRFLLGLTAGVVSYRASGGHLLGSISFTAAGWALAGQAIALLRQPKMRQVGGIVVHIGIIVMLIGITGSSIFVEEVYRTVEPGETIEFGGYALEYPGLQVQWGVDYYNVQTALQIMRGGEKAGTLVSSKTFYGTDDQPYTEVGIFSTPFEDLYLNLAGWQGQTAQLHIKRLAFVSWIWAGAAVVFLGVLLLLKGDKNVGSA